MTTAALGVVIAASEHGGGPGRRGRRPAVASATGGSSSAMAVALSRTIIRGMLMTKLKIVAAAALALAGSLSAGVVAVGARSAG